MLKRFFCVSALLSFLLSFGCAEFKDSIREWTEPKEEKKAKSKTPAETPKEATTQKQPESAQKDTSGSIKSAEAATPDPKTQDTKGKATTPKKSGTSSDQSGSVFGPK
jgi:hypothetical protein